MAVAVTDSGPGVDPEMASQIFDPFFSGREAGRGLGFGLSKAWRIIQLHGGDIELDNAWTDGARFVITLPLRQIESRDAASQPIDKVQAA